MQDEICTLARSIMDSFEKASGVWNVNVVQSFHQWNIWLINVDCLVRDDEGSTFYSGRCGVHHKEWPKWSESEKEFFLRQRIGELIEEISKQVEVDAHADV